MGNEAMDHFVKQLYDVGFHGTQSVISFTGVANVVLFFNHVNVNARALHAPSVFNGALVVPP